MCKVVVWLKKNFCFFAVLVQLNENWSIVYISLNSNQVRGYQTGSAGRRAGPSTLAILFSADIATVPFHVTHIFDDPEDVCWVWGKLLPDELDLQSTCAIHETRITWLHSSP